MKVLVIGSGGREHAFVWKLAQSPCLSRLYCAPGNAGTAELAENVPISAEDIPALLAFARENAVDFTVVGPELPLALGIVDRFRQEGRSIFGPTQQAAELETSKDFAKTIMAEYGIPTAPFQTFSDPRQAERYVDRHAMPLVVKANGLAAGKGVIICKTRDSAYHAIDQIMRAKVFGDAGAQVVIEEFLEGEEVSLFALTDGTSLLPLPICQDHKAIYDGDQGPNTGGMGAYSPVLSIDVGLSERLVEEIMQPIVRAMAAAGRQYQGVLYAGLMLVDRRPYVLEFNARFGDPEAQVLMMRLDSDLLPLLLATTDGTLNRQSCRWLEDAAACVVMVSRGYPDAYERGKPIAGVTSAPEVSGVVVFHAGTARRDGQLVTSGGRVLGVTARAPDLHQALDRAYQTVHRIAWDGVHYRTDIGRKAMERR
ncbi:MAG TPA: phosphoribosylamine--glycine ligase [Candidatus Tectomicrobia bacterium]